jgi:hypothetical protein
MRKNDRKGPGIETSFGASGGGVVASEDCASPAGDGKDGTGSVLRASADEHKQTLRRPMTNGLGGRKNPFTVRQCRITSPHSLHCRNITL